MILVTGGTGLVGSHLLYQLTLNNDAIRAIYRTEQRLESVKKVFSYFTDDVDTAFKKIEWIQADITETTSLEVAFKDIAIVYHAAALVSFDSKYYRKMRQVNIDGTANIVNFCIAGNVQKLCFVSSIAAVGDAVSKEDITEENEWTVSAGSNGYSITKHGAEMEVWRASQEGVDVVIVNPGVILGAGFWKVNTGLFFSKVANGFKYFTEGVTGFVGVKDVARAMIDLTESNVVNQRFILVSENVSFKFIFNEIAKQLYKNPPSIKIPKWFTSVLWRVDYLVSKLVRKSQLLTKEGASSLHNRSKYSSNKIQTEIGFKFTPVKMVIMDICKSYLKK